MFTPESTGIRPYEFPDAVHLSLSYEMNLDKFVIYRTVYTTLDWLGDVGGLMGILFDMGGFLLMFVTGSGLNYMLLHAIFKEEGPRAGNSTDRTDTDEKLG